MVKDINQKESNDAESTTSVQYASISNNQDFYSRVASTPPNACASCIKELNVVLLRYSGLGSEDAKSLQKLAPVLPDSLTGNVLPEMQSARYAVRFLHKGYIYIVMNRVNSGWGLDACLYVENEERIKNIYPQDVSIRNTVTAHTYGTAIKIQFPADVQECRIVYSMSELTATQLQAMMTDAALRDKMQLFDVQALLQQPESIQQNILPTAMLEQYVAEIIAIKPSMNALYNLDKGQQDYSERGRLIAEDDLLALLYSQYHQTPSSLHFNEYVWTGLANTYKNGQSNGKRPPDKMSAAFVLLNPIGITQELNHWRNNAWVHFQTDYLNQKQGRYTNGFRLHIANSLVELEEQYPVFVDCAAISTEWRDYCESQKVEAELKRSKDYCKLIEGIGDSYDLRECEKPYSTNDSAIPAYKTEDEFDLDIAANRQKILSNWQALEAKIQNEALFTEANKARHRETFTNQFKPLFNQVTINKEKAAYEKAWQAVKTLVQGRYDDHNMWLMGANFDDALNFYDQHDVNSGLAFANDTGHCIVGVSGTEKGLQEIFKQFLTRKENEEEWALAIRAIAFNQQTLLNKISELQIQIPDPGVGNEAVLTSDSIKTVRSIAKLVKPFLDLAESKAGDHGGMYAWVHQLQMTVLGSEGLRTADAGMRKVLRSLLISQSLRGVDLLRDPLVEALMGPSTPQLKKQMSELFAGFEEERSFSKVRLAGLMLFIEALNFVTLLNKKEMEWEDILKCVGSAFSTFSAMNELAATYLIHQVQRVAARTSFNATHRLIVNGTMQRIVVFKFAGASLGVVGTTLSMLPDIVTNSKKAWESFFEKRWLLGTTYGVKLLADVALIAGAGHKTFVLISPFFNRIALSSTTEHSLNVFGELAVTKVLEKWHLQGRIIGLRGALGVLITSGWGLIALTAISILIPLIIDYFFPEDPVELDDWLKRSIYAQPVTSVNDKDIKPYNDADKELMDYQKAIQHLLKGVPVTFYEVQYIREKQWIAENS